MRAPRPYVATGDTWRSDWCDLTPTEGVGMYDPGEVTFTERQPTGTIYHPDGTVLTVVCDRLPFGFHR